MFVFFSESLYQINGVKLYDMGYVWYANNSRIRLWEKSLSHTDWILKKRSRRELLQNYFIKPVRTGTVISDIYYLTE